MFILKKRHHEENVSGTLPIGYGESDRIYIENPEGKDCGIGCGWIGLNVLKELINAECNKFYVKVNDELMLLKHENFEHLIQQLPLEQD